MPPKQQLKVDTNSPYAITLNCGNQTIISSFNNEMSEKEIEKWFNGQQYLHFFNESKFPAGTLLHNRQARIPLFVDTFYKDALTEKSVFHTPETILINAALITNEDSDKLYKAMYVVKRNAGIHLKVCENYAKNYHDLKNINKMKWTKCLKGNFRHNVDECDECQISEVIAHYYQDGGSFETSICKQAFNFLMHIKKLAYCLFCKNISIITTSNLHCVCCTYVLGENDLIVYWGHEDYGQLVLILENQDANLFERIQDHFIDQI